MVATVVELRSSAVAVRYYERDGYYAKNDPEHRQASFWHGEAARALGLRAHVRPSRFESVLSGRVPGTQTRLGRMREGEHEHRPGWDLTFSAPKSVSLEALVMGDRRVIRAHDEAVRATLDWVEGELLETRGWDPAARRRPRVKAHGMVVAGFRHLTSRDLDPQLHTHCVLANMTRNACGEWRSVEPARLRRGEKLMGAYYRNELARRLQALGMAVVPTLVGRVPGFELSGYERSFLEAFSGRRREIVAHLERLGLAYTAAHTRMAALSTRRRKRDGRVAELVPQWRERARSLGLAREKAALSPPRPVDPLTGERIRLPRVPTPERLAANEIRSLKRAPALPKLPCDGLAERATRRPARALAPAVLSPEPERGVVEAVARAVAHVGERRTVLWEAEVRAVALGHAPGRYTLSAVDAAVARLVEGGEVIEVPRRGMDRAFVTDRAVRAERRVLASMRAGRGKGSVLAEGAAVEARLRESRLSQGQKAAVRTVLLSVDVVVGVQGHAGSGKTTMLGEVKALVGHRPILGLAPSATAARVLAREAGIASRTLQYFLTRFGDLSDPRRLARARAEQAGAVLVVDEASMIDTARMEALLRIAARVGAARVVLVGDTAQLRAVDAGQPFGLLQKAGMATATMDEVLRQRDPVLRRAVLQAREGEPGAALEGLGERVREVPREALGAEAGRCWLALSPGERAGTLILAPTHAIRRQANVTVREGLEREGVLRGRVLAVERLVDRRLTRAQASAIGSYEPGDTAVFHRDVFGCRANDVCTVMEHEAGRVVLAHPDGGQRRFRPSGNAAGYLGLYDTERIELRAGDRVRWTRNRKAPQARFSHPPAPALVNGGEARILEVGYKRVRFRDGDGREFKLALADPQLRHLDHAYCSTVHGAQGRTARAAIAVLDAGGAGVDRALFHVELSRAAEAFVLLTDDREALIERLAGSGGGREDGALEALGLDPAVIPAVDPEPFAALAADWRALRRRGEETNTAGCFQPGYRAVMARAAALSAIEEDLPTDMRGLVGRMLAAHEGHLARERTAAALTDRIRAHWRRWPELGWAASARGVAREALSAHGAWREEGAALMEAGRRRLAADGEAARYLDALAGAVKTLERTHLLDDAGRFERAWRALRERAAHDGMPERLTHGYRAVAALGERLAGAAGLQAPSRRAVAAWRTVDAAQTALDDEVRVLPHEMATWRSGRTSVLPLDEHGAADPSHRACRAWREAGRRLEARAEEMLRPGGVHAPYLAVAPGAGESVRQAAAAIREALVDDRRRAFEWLTRAVSRQAHETLTEPFHVPRYGEMIAQARALSPDEGLPAARRPVLDSWLRYHEESTRRCHDIRDWPGRAAAVMAEYPEAPARLGALRQWRQQVAPLLAEARGMQTALGPHAPHLDAMADQREALLRADRRLDAQLTAVEAREMDLRWTVARRWAAQTGGIAFDAPGYGGLMERVRSLDARRGLPGEVRGTVRDHLDQDTGWTRDRERAGAFLDRVAKVERAWTAPAEGRPDADDWRRTAVQVLDEAKTLRKDIAKHDLAAHLRAAGAGPGALEQSEEKLRYSIGLDERVREEKRSQDHGLSM